MERHSEHTCGACAVYVCCLNYVCLCAVCLCPCVCVVPSEGQLCSKSSAEGPGRWAGGDPVFPNPSDLSDKCPGSTRGSRGW